MCSSVGMSALHDHACLCVCVHSCCSDRPLFVDPQTFIILHMHMGMFLLQPCFCCSRMYVSRHVNVGSFMRHVSSTSGTWAETCVQVCKHTHLMVQTQVCAFVVAAGQAFWACDGMCVCAYMWVRTFSSMRAHRRCVHTHV